VVLVDGPCVEVEDLGDHPDLAAGAGDRLADVLGLDAGQLFVIFLDEHGQAAEQAGAVGGRDRAPGGEGPLRARDGGVGLLDAGLRELRDRLLGSRVEDGDHPRSFR
jgi:hypothetical protein